MLRIIAGSLKGRLIKSGKNPSLRPTKDRVKETLFAKLGNIENKRVIDIFAGTGNLGFEALSRGAEHCVFVDNNKINTEIIKSNALSLKVLDKVDIRCNDAALILKNGINIDIILADPPYKYSNFNNLFREFERLREDTIIVLETYKNFIPPASFQERYISYKVIGETSLNFFRV